MGQWNDFLSPGVVFFGVVAYYGCLWALAGFRFRAKGLRLPPGPTPQSFIFGNLAQVPKVEPWLTFTSWAQTYGPIVHFRVFNNHTVLLNTAKAVFDLLESRSSVYSERPTQWMAGELTGRKYGVFMTSFSDPRYKVMRRLLQQGLNSRASKSYRPIQMQETLVLLQGLADNPRDFAAHIRRNAVAVIMKVAYGYQVSSNDDQMVSTLEEAFRIHATLIVPGKYWVELFPMLRFLPEWMPGAGFRRVAREFGKTLHRVEEIPLVWARENMVLPSFHLLFLGNILTDSLQDTGDFVESFTSRNLSTDDGRVPDDTKLDYIKWCAAALYIGGGDTTVSALTTFFLLMSLYPEVQKQAQRDIDRIAPNRHPTLDDHESLPYIRAMIKEILRWAPVAPLGIPHRVMEDNIYENYFIPKDTRIIANIWAITHDEEMYPNPQLFDPARHLGESPQPDPFKFVFGFGRRVCPGAHLAEMSLFLNIANILATFDISKAVDERGVAIDPSIAWTTGVTRSEYCSFNSVDGCADPLLMYRHLKPFDCQIKPRSKSVFL
ncbi:hypothetical protein CVT25_007410 [Psilocybe cyanescens]|uniref:Cytochrome P450 n=1 Tax=Psilocybe cyanescens TaxID=93625 RepID=A0A409XGC2_PSICY|nr:hypothetical protein CVT25_007410 [Psilocybe cyanescens]